MTAAFDAPDSPRLGRPVTASTAERARIARLRRIGRLLWRAAPTAAFAWLCVFLLGDRFSEIRWADITAALSAIPAQNLALALGLAALSHLALACYDLLAFRRLGRRIPWTRALKGGFAAGSFAQTLGFGVITGSVARLRIYRANGVTAGRALALTALAALGFFSGLFVLLACLAVADPTPAAALVDAPDDAIRALAAATLVCAAIAARWAGRRRPSLRVGEQEIGAPGLRWLLAATALSAADVLPAAFCFWALLPAGAAPDLFAYAAIFIVATGLGLLSGSPGAFGPFEAVVFLALPATPAAEIAAAVLAFRAIYYLPAFAVAAYLVTRARQAPKTLILAGDSLRERIDWTIDLERRAEAELAMLGDKHAYMPAAGGAMVCYGVAGRVWLAMGEPLGPRADWPWLVDGLEAEARSAGAALAVYKATEDGAAFWASRGYRLWPLGEEAALDPAAFTLEGAPRRELRRKICKAERAGVEIAFFEPTEAPLDELEEVAAEWRAAHGGREKGFSMGVWSRAFVHRHPVLTASVDGRVAAFISLWVSGDGREWMLDLMRQRPDAPNGVMHALVAAAIARSAERGATSFNLCMAPFSGLAEDAPRFGYERAVNFVYRRFDRWHGLTGMRRFKEIFRPDWRRRYLAAPDALTAAEAFIAAHRLVSGAVWPGGAETARSPILNPAPVTVERWDDAGEAGAETAAKGDAAASGREPAPDPDAIWIEEDLDELARSGERDRNVA